MHVIQMYSAYDSFKPYSGYNMSDINMIQNKPPANIFQDSELPTFPQAWDINKMTNSEKSMSYEEMYIDDMNSDCDYGEVCRFLSSVPTNDFLTEQSSPPSKTTENEDVNDVDILNMPDIPYGLYAFCEQMFNESKPFMNDINNSECLSGFENISAEVSAHSADIATNGSIETNTYTYHPDDDHSYFKVHNDDDDDDDDTNIDHTMDIVNLWKRVGSPDSSGSSSEVDVVTVTEELQTPIVPKVQISFKNKRQKKGQKPRKVKKNKNPLSAKTLNEAMKRNMKRITTVRRTYRRRINNSVESTPPNSLPSSSPSSRCSSDVEDAGKRANHNSSERKRREVLRTNLQNLRVCVPDVQNNPKAPKVHILNAARKYIKELESSKQHCLFAEQKEVSKNRLLKAKLKKLLLGLRRSVYS